jgi:MFS family permease
MALVTVLGLAFYDTCCDGMVIDITPPSRRSSVQGLLWVSRFAATTICTFGFGRWLDRPGMGQEGVPMVLWACVALGLVPLLLSRTAPEAPRSADAEGHSWAALGCLARPWTLMLLAYGGLYAMAGVGAEFKLAAYYKDLGYGPGAIGDLGSVRFLGRAAGALLLPFAGRHLGQRVRLVIGLCGLIASTAGQAFITGPLSAATFAFLFGVANGWSDALFAVLAMQGSDPRLAASTFAIIMAVSNLSVAGNAAFAYLATALGSFRQAYLITAAAIVPLLLFVIPLGRPGPDGHPVKGPS